MNWAYRLLTLLAIAGVFGFSPAARADELQDINTLMKQGQHAQALEQVNKYLAQKPRDAQGRFLKGLILTEQNKVNEAIDVFAKLSQDYPKLPEPYNNLAVLYAAQGQYEKARQQLELSIRTHPSYATAYENLGDVYTKLASQSYDKALQLDSSNAAAKNKLSLVHELISGGSRPSRATEAMTTVAPAAPIAPTVVAAAPKSAPQPATPVEKPAAKSTSPSKPVEAPKAATPAPETREVLDAVRAWADAWSKKNADAYLAFYAKDFKTPNGESRTLWEKTRRQRIAAPKSIEVTIESPKAVMDKDSAVVTFRQHYRSDHLKTRGGKTLVMIKSEGRWMIREERTGS